LQSEVVLYQVSDEEFDSAGAGSGPDEGAVRVFREGSQPYAVRFDRGAVPRGRFREWVYPFIPVRAHFIQAHS
jgi:hypothetical protein